MKFKIIAMAALAALSGTAMAAGSATANFQVTATVNSSCTVSATNVNFAAVTPAATGDATAPGTITSTCTKNTPYKLAINAGSGTIAQRTMGGTGGNTDKLNYNLYTDNTYTKVWGQTPGTDTVDLTGDGTAQTSTIYGKLPLNQYVKADSYSDNLTVTINY